MLVKDLVTILEALAQNALLYADEAAATDFRQIAASLRKQRKTLRLNEAETYWSRFSIRETESSGSSKMSAKKVADHLRLVSNVAEPSAKKGALEPLKSFVRFLDEQGSASAAQVLSPIVRALPSKDWLKELTSAGPDRDAFDAAVTGLSKDKGVDTELLNSISASYSGIKGKPKSRKEAIERLRDHFEADAQYASKVSAIDRMTGARPK